MSDDLLERATAALRDSTSATADDAARQRAKLLAQAAKRARPTPLWQWAAVAFTGLFVSSAMAQLGGYMPTILRVLTREAGMEAPAVAPAVKPSAAAVRRANRPSAAVKDDAAGSSTATPGLENPPPSAARGNADNPPPSAARGNADNPPPSAAPRAMRSGDRARPARATASGEPPRKPQAPGPQRELSVSAPAASTDTTSASITPARSRSTSTTTGPKPEPAGTAKLDAPSNPPPSAAPPESAELVLFRRAQNLHLAHAPEALAAWDAYLRVASRGTLVPEARYNRALCLVRLHRYSEARAALEPFAAGDSGGYRQREAKALLARLPH